jgi:homoserine dehydrogenase
MTTKAIREVRLLLIGVGNVGRAFLELLAWKEPVLRDRFGLGLVAVGVADTSGVAVCADGLDPQEVVQLKAGGHGVARHPRWGRAAVPALEMVRTTDADVLIEASPVNLEDGQPGLGCIEAALARGMHVVTANKAPLVLAFPRLLSLARARGVQLRYDATVAGGLPAVNLGQRDLAAADILRLEGVLNLTTNAILTRMARDRVPYPEALADAQAAGHTETDPRLDVEGWDAANKLVILAHSVLGYPATLADVEVEGITHLTPGTLRRAAAEGKQVKLVASAERAESGYRLRVCPTWLAADHPLAQLGPDQMGIVYWTDICGVISAAIVEETPMPTAAAVLRDVIELFRQDSR